MKHFHPMACVLSRLTAYRGMRPVFISDAVARNRRDTPAIWTAISAALADDRRAA